MFADHRMLIWDELDALAKYQSATGATPDAATGLLSLTAAQFAKLKSLFFNIGGVSVPSTFVFSPLH